MVAAEHKSDFEVTTDNYAIAKESWGVCGKDLGENWPLPR